MSEPLPKLDWKPFLESYARIVLSDPDVRERIAAESPAAVTSQWLGFEGATEAEIAQIEEKIGARLPPSYRRFLATSNGWRFANYNVTDLLPVRRLGWFRDQYPDWITAWEDESEGPRDCEPEHRITGAELGDMLVIAEASENDEIYLLNPHVRTEAGDWQALVFSDHLPGALRFQTFRDLLEAELALFKASLATL